MALPGLTRPWTGPWTALRPAHSPPTTSWTTRERRGPRTIEEEVAHSPLDNSRPDGRGQPDERWARVAHMPTATTTTDLYDPLLISPGTSGRSWRLRRMDPNRPLGPVM